MKVVGGIKYMIEYNKENDVIQEFICGVDKMVSMHKNNDYLCVNSNEWNYGGCGWENVYFTPEHRRDCYERVEHETVFYDDIYMLMIKLYKRITGIELSAGFRKNRNWLYVLNIKTDGWKHSKEIISILSKCTKPNANNYFDKIEKLVSLDEYKKLLLPLQK